jgi:hypothetical protein
MLLWRRVAASAVILVGVSQVAYWGGLAVAFDWAARGVAWRWLSGPALVVACCVATGVTLLRDPMCAPLATGMMLGVIVTLLDARLPHAVGLAAAIVLVLCATLGSAEWREGWRRSTTDTVRGATLVPTLFVSLGGPGWRGDDSAWAVVVPALLVLCAVFRAKTISLVALVGAAFALMAGSASPPTWWNGGCVTHVHPIGAGWLAALPLLGAFLFWVGPMVRYVARPT